MIDFHTHILPGVDDGSKDILQTEAMLREMCVQDVSTVVATPHFDMRLESIESFLKRRETAVSKISFENPDFPKVIVGSEVFCCGIDFSKIENLRSLCIGETDYMLVETYFNKLDEGFVKNMRSLLFERNIIPILAHTERYYFIGKNSSIIHKLSLDGMILQMNAEVFIKRSTRRRAFKLLKRETIGLLGSDCHDIQKRPPNLKMASDIIQKKTGSDILTYIEKNSLKILGL